MQKDTVLKSGINKRVTCHISLHSFAIYLHKCGHDIRTVQGLLGHRSVRATMIYTHVHNRGLEVVISSLDKIKGLPDWLGPWGAKTVALLLDLYSGDSKAWTNRSSRWRCVMPYLHYVSQSRRSLAQPNTDRERYCKTAGKRFEQRKVWQRSFWRTWVVTSSEYEFRPIC
jgi:hypothetical protein